jgi:exopolyphosphatase/guanosine-5'-triphosphate,3'-diphosphate pyrophosphatase
MKGGKVVAVIDVGSNAVKATVARVSGGRIVEPLAERRVQTRLGEGVAASGEFTPDSVQRTCDAVRGIIAEARALGAQAFRLAGTSAVREASNTDALAECISAASGLALEVLTGEDEARLSFKAVSSETADSEVAVFDLGGGSLEWIVGSGGGMLWRRSFPVGAVRLASLLTSDPPSPAEVEAVRTAVRTALSGLPDVSGRPLISVGGTASVMLSVAAAAGRAPEERRLSAEEIHRQAVLYASMNLAERRSIPGMEPDRADIILPGALVVEECVLRARADRIIVSFRGWRHGMLCEM